MEQEIIKFPSIEQFRQVLPAIVKAAQFNHLDPQPNQPFYETLPVIEFRGTVKIHGSNTAIVQTISSTPEKAIHFQSRNRILTTERESDLMGFCTYMTGKIESIRSIFESISFSLKLPSNESNQSKEGIRAIAIYGEWCGQGIQNGVAISKLPKMFVIFAVKVIYNGETPEKWLDPLKLPEITRESARIFNIMQFATYRLVIDFKNEENIAKGRLEMTEMALGVEAECPVSKYFGVSGVGEGIVWQAIPSPNSSMFITGRYSDPRFWFKVKGEKHRNRGGKLSNKPIKDPEVGLKMNAFIDLVLTPDRLQQGLQVLERELLLPLDMTSISAFLQWVKKDVIKEEYDRIKEAGLSEKEISAPVSNAAKKWYIEVLKA